MPWPPPMHRVTTPRLEAVAAHRVQQARRQHRAGRADRMAVRDGAALDVDDVLRQAELARDGERHGGERLVDLDALDVAERPAGALQRLPHGGHGPEAEHARLDRRDAVGDQPRASARGPAASAKPRSATIIAAAPLLRPGALPAVMVPSGRKAGLSLARVSSVVSGRLCLVLGEDLRALAALDLDRRRSRASNLPGRLRGGEALLRALAPSGPAPRGVIWYLVDQVLGVPARMLAREGVVQAVAQHAVVDLRRRPCGSPSGRRPAGRARGPCSPCRRRLRRRSWPSQISCAAVTIACAPEPQTRLTVIAGTETGRPPSIAAWRAGFIRLPAWMTLPMTTLPIALGVEARSAPASRGRPRRRARWPGRP